MAWDPSTPYNDLPLLPPDYTPSILIFAKVIEARVALAMLNQAVNDIPNNNILLETIPVLEAQSSSEIERIYTTTESMFKHKAFSSNADPATKEALCYKDAIWAGVQSLKKRPISYRVMSDICSTLRNTHVEVRTQPGTYIASAQIDRIYTPPEGSERLLKKLDNLSTFLNQHNEPGDGLDPLIKMAMGHYQFEAIHPFTDGNGRTGRVLNILYLMEQGLLDTPVLTLSKYIIQNKGEYYDRLMAVTKDHDWEAWILFMIDAVKATSRWTLDKVKAMVKLRDETIAYMKADPRLKRIDSYELVQLLFMHPYARVNNLVEAQLAHRQTASKYLNHLVEVGFLEKSRENGEYLYKNKRLMQLLTSENHLYDPLPTVPDGDKR